MGRKSEIASLKRWVKNAKTDFEEGYANQALRDAEDYWKLSDKVRQGKRMTKAEWTRHQELTDKRIQAMLWEAEQRAIDLRAREKHWKDKK